ncbi:hypothetical protein [Aestuariibius sp. HNIBRBA575]|uniref:hypothetical protein n=1 Tax=Aestuariibius sp. HNIBRBA575 TaxID=3233343 RepID=UPI0034A51DBA
MMTAAPYIVDLFLSISAVIGLLLMRAMIVDQGRYDPLNQRFLFGVHAMILLFGARAAYSLTDLNLFRALVLFAAALVPLAALLLTEGLLRRHAAKFIKVGFAVMTTLLSVSALFPVELVDPFRLVILLMFQVAGFLICGLLVFTRDVSSLSRAENQMAERIGLSVFLLLPFAAADFLMVYFNLPVRVSALGVLFLCWLSITLGKSSRSHIDALMGFCVTVVAAILSGATVSFLMGFSWNATIMTVAILLGSALCAALYNEIRTLKTEAQGVAVLEEMSKNSASSPMDFLRNVVGNMDNDGVALIDLDTLHDCQEEVLTELFRKHPVLRRSDPIPSNPDLAEHKSHLFERYQASHILCAQAQPLTLIALSIPMIAATKRVESELNAAQSFSRLLEVKNAE